jgi:hypothetical protein
MKEDIYGKLIEKTFESHSILKNPRGVKIKDILRIIEKCLYWNRKMGKRNFNIYTTLLTYVNSIDICQ